MEAWQAVCDSAQALGQQPAPPVVRSFFERQFRPYRVTNGGDPGGLFTGYFEPLLHGSRTKTGPYTVPLRRRPDDLIRVDLGRFDGDLEGEKIYGHVQGQTLVPYYTRGEIAEGALGERDLEILWVDSRVDKFFLQIQGSGRVRLRDSTIVRVGYAAENGQPYRAIGRDLIQMDALTKENVSLQTIRRWLQNHPDRAGEVMERNRSYVFFRRLDSLSADEGPIGSQGVPLTPRRSLAVDTRYVPLGAPLWLTTEAPVPGDTSKTRPFRQLMIAQDTGGAIRGPVRGDVFWGAGDTARAIAGRMQSPGQYVILLPRSVDPPA
jgi:membrane-bound lytic murein transglycosylase A